MDTSKIIADKWRLFAGLLLLALGGCVVAHYRSITVDWSRTKDASDSLKNSAEIAAVTVGAVWAYFRFWKGRTYQETLGLKVAGKFISSAGVSYLLIMAEVKNIGLSNVHITEKGTGIALWRYKYFDNLSGVLSVDKESLAGFSLVDEGSSLASSQSENKELFSLEPNETIAFERLCGIPPPLGLAVRVELQVTSTGKYAWQAATIVKETGTLGGSSDV